MTRPAPSEARVDRVDDVLDRLVLDVRERGALQVTGGTRWLDEAW